MKCYPIRETESLRLLSNLFITTLQKYKVPYDHFSVSVWNNEIFPWCKAVVFKLQSGDPQGSMKHKQGVCNLFIYFLLSYSAGNINPLLSNLSYLLLTSYSYQPKWLLLIPNPSNWKTNRPINNVNLDII